MESAVSVASADCDPSVGNVQDREIELAVTVEIRIDEGQWTVTGKHDRPGITGNGSGGFVDRCAHGVLHSFRAEVLPQAVLRRFRVKPRCGGSLSKAASGLLP